MANRPGAIMMAKLAERLALEHGMDPAMATKLCDPDSWYLETTAVLPVNKPRVRPAWSVTDECIAAFPRLRRLPPIRTSTELVNQLHKIGAMGLAGAGNHAPGAAN